MAIINNNIFEEFETILKKMIEQFQEVERDGDVDFIFDQINHFHGLKNDIEEYEKEIKSRTRPLRLGFVGGFSTGKSSMINSLLGEEILGVKLEPATAQITELSYGEKFEIIEVTEDDDYFYYDDVSLEEYQKRSTVRANKNKNLSHYIIKHPSKNLSRFTIVDTPGFSSTSKEDDELTKNWIESLDLLIWIFDANKVGDKEEYNKLKELGSSTKVIGVINKIDTKSPGVREKIRNEILNEDFLDDVFFYSSKKVLEECVKSKSYNDIVENITSQIKDSVNNSESFEIINVNSEIIFKTDTTTKPFSLNPPKKTIYIEYYDELINKIDNVRDNEINLILNRTLVNKHNNFRNRIKEELLRYQELFNGEVNDYTRQIKESSDLLQKSETIFKAHEKDFDDKLDASFNVFYRSFFGRLGDFLFGKHIDTGVFSDDLYIVMINADEDKVRNEINEFISNEFQSFLESSFDIYENIINNSIYKEFSKIEEIRYEKYHSIHILVEGLVTNSLDSIIGYHRNFEPYKTDAYLEAIQFQKSNIDLVVPDELLKSSINTLLIYDLIDARYLGYDPAVEIEIEEQESEKNNALEILKMIGKLLKKID